MRHLRESEGVFSLYQVVELTEALIMGAPKINHQIDHQVSGQFDVLLKADLILISNDAELVNLTKGFCEQFKFKCIYFQNSTEFHQKYKVSLKPGLVIYKREEGLSETELKSQYKNLKTILKKIPLCLISSHEPVGFVKAPDFTFSDKQMAAQAVQYLILMKLKGDSYEIKHDDLFPSSVVSFNAYHLMPVSRKFLPVVFQRLPLSEKKFSKLEKIKKLFIRGSDTSLYKDYVESFFDESDFGSKKRAKAHLYQFLGHFFHLKYIFLVGASPEQIREVSKELHDSLLNLKRYLERVPQPFNYIFSLTKNDFLALDQSWFIALSCGFVALTLKWPNELIFAKIAMASFPESLKMQVHDRLNLLEITQEERAVLDAMSGGEPLNRLAPDIFPAVFLQQFFVEFAQKMDFSREVSIEDFMTTSRSFWRHQNEIHTGEMAQKLLVSMRDLFCS